jgi:hypothetical protein
MLTDCAEDDITRVPSPDHRWEAVSYRANCGATTSYVRLVAIMRPGRWPGRSGDIYASDDADVLLRWTAPDALTVRHPQAVRVYRTKPVMHGISINHQEY